MTKTRAASATRVSNSFWSRLYWMEGSSFVLMVPLAWVNV
jgi:hypothetical protein